MLVTTLVHISDLHFGDADQARLNAALVAINAVAPDCVVMTGDLTQSGRQSEFDILVLHHPPQTPIGARVRSEPSNLDNFNGHGQRGRPSFLMCGHVHDVYDFSAASIGGVRVITAPSLASHRERGEGERVVAVEIGANDSDVTCTYWRFQNDAFVECQPIGAQ